ncbi:LysR family transcriptional regulator [Marinomonas ushuaiensis DSM 15871]|uniref:LysR family transcriptional regulator n=1 Tax=Marinomonas ushuaiensis DSM 15871 TaxID=1122207 RepID=X7E5L3_9GAMM|nr:LysR family transcriptional regulator [Marinomonas ushuaiensis]ETX11349.1 LysR family transcriptional regulator [Marinomonas ushuaiensis DSM 15871]
MVKADDILLFVHVVEEASFSRVSEKLRITMSVVSKRITRLEKDLNVQLLYRTTRKLSLTEAGQALYKKAKIAQLAVQDAKDVVAGFSSDVRGKIRITMPVVTANLVLNRAAVEFCEQYPGIELELNVTNRLSNILDEGFDLAIRTADLGDSSLVARRLVDSQWCVCATPEYLHIHGAPQHPDDLMKHHCLLYKYSGKKPDPWSFQVENTDLNCHVTGRFQADNLDSIKQAAMSDFGVAYLPRALIFNELKSGELVTSLDEFANKKLGIYAVYPNTRLVDKKLTLLIEHFRNALQQNKSYFS